MVLSGESLFSTILAVIVVVLCIFYYYLTSNNDYWRKRNVPYVKPDLFFGNLKDQYLFKKSALLVMDDIYKALQGEKFGGYFDCRTPMLMIRDPALIQRILVKDFVHFQNRDFGVDVDMKRDPLSGNLFALKGQLWRNLRNKLTPIFTSGKLRGMLDQMSDCADELLSTIEKTAKSNQALDAKIVGTTFAIDVTASVSFGLQFKADTPEGIRFREVANLTFDISSWRLAKTVFIMTFKRLSKLLNVTATPKEVTEYMVGLVKSTIEFRKNNNIKRNDFLQLMINLKEQEESGKEMNWKSELNEEDAYLNHMEYSNKETGQSRVITDECIAAQSFVFLTGGSEALANSIQFALYELGANPQIQARLQLEIDSVLSKYGDLTYEGLREMEYLDLFIQERNRKYSEASMLLRVCEIPYLIPGTSVVVDKGTRVVIPAYSLHHDQAYYPEPDNFIPERFEKNHHRNNNSTYIPFGDGPRVCIAMRFVIMEQKVFLAKLLSRYSVSLDPQTRVPMEFNPKSFVFQPLGGVWVRFHHRYE